MKLKATIIFAVSVVVFLLITVLFVPKIFKSEKENISSTITSNTNTSTESKQIKTYTLKEMVELSDNVLSGTVIKADVFEEGVLYTITVSWAEVFKGRNYATMGYAYLKGPKTLQLNKTYLFIGDTGDEKYHYYEPFENAPWVFEINEDNPLIHVSNGDIKLLKVDTPLTVELIKSACKEEKSSN